MNAHISSDLSLPEEARDVLWRIVGNNESPLNHEPTARLAERTIRKYANHLPSARQDTAIAEVCRLFEYHGDKGSLKVEVGEPVAHVVATGINIALSSETGVKNHETAFCAVGSLDPDLAVDAIASIFSGRALAEFENYGIRTLKDLRKKAAVIDPNRCMWPTRIEGDNTTASSKEVPHERRFDTLRMLKSYDWWLHSCVANMIEFLVKLKPAHFFTLIDEIDDPLVQLRAARCYLDRYGDATSHGALQWISNTSSDDLIVLAIVHLLDDVNRMEHASRLAAAGNDHSDDSELEASRLLSDMLERIGSLEPLARARWIAELLSCGMAALNSSARKRKSGRFEQLEEFCVHQIDSLVRDSWSDELLDEFRARIFLTPSAPRILPLATAAFGMREVEPVRCAAIARLILETFTSKVDEAIRSDRSFDCFLDNPAYVDWVHGLAIALVLSDKDLDLRRWVRDGCRELRLDAWDVEEDTRRFLNIESVVRFRFLIALYAVQIRRDVDDSVERGVVIGLAEDLWAHQEFVGQYFRLMEDPNVSMLAARVAVAFGDPSREWMLEQAKSEGVCPSTLWTLIDQAVVNDGEGHGPKKDGFPGLLEGFHSVACNRFGDMRVMAQEDILYLGEIWLLLEAFEEAEMTAMILLSLPQASIGRDRQILALKLLALVSRNKRLNASVENEFRSLYGKLWSTRTPDNEQVSREQVDALLVKASESHRLQCFPLSGSSTL